MDDHERMKAYYDRRAPEYDRSILGLGEAAPPKDIAEDRAALLQAISRLPPGRVLDVGCGTPAI
jgi:ubiquinone/menaquinone biosynthesis C-methylase UbiE